MDKITILTKYKNELLSIIQESGLDPNLFIAKEEVINNVKHFVISVRDSQIIFTVKDYLESFYSFSCQYSQFNANFSTTSDYPQNFDSLAGILKEWLEETVKPYLDEINTPNLWQILEQNRIRTKDKIGTPEDFKLFSEDEKCQIRLSITDFRLSIIKNFEPNKEVLDSIDARLKYLSEAVDKHNKFDWKGIAINTVIAITIALALNPEQSSKLFHLFQQVFTQILYLLP
jgi:hypothetical protein